MKKRIISLVLCAVFIVSLSVVASADASRFFISDVIYNGYDITFRGIISGRTAKAVFEATPTDEPYQMIIPEGLVSSAVTVIAYNDNDDDICSETNTGTTYTVAECRSRNEPIAYTENSLMLDIEDVEGYILVNN